METNVDIDTLRRKAITLLQGILQQTYGRSHEETAYAIADLALQDGNAVKDLFAATTATGTQL